MLASKWFNVFAAIIFVAIGVYIAMIQPEIMSKSFREDFFGISMGLAAIVMIIENKKLRKQLETKK